MTGLLDQIPWQLLFVLIFLLRVTDVTLGTIRTVSIVKGRIALSVALGFFEVMVWIVAMTQVVARLEENWWLTFAWAGGFATGNAVGILVERRLELGMAVVRILTGDRSDEIVAALRGQGHDVTSFRGEGDAGPVTLLYAVAPRRQTVRMLDIARSIDPELVYVSEPALESGHGVGLRLRPVPHPTGWRAVLKKK